MKTHLSASFFNSMLLRCQSEKMAQERGEIEFIETDPILIGGYVDAHFSGTLDQYKAKKPICKKGGEPYAKFTQADEIIKVGESDPLFMKYMSGEPQFKVEGIIGGVKFIGFLDSYHKGKCIAELKVVKSIRETTWNNETKQRENFIQSNGYLNQKAIYQELVRQMTGDKLPCYICALSKEKAIDKEVIFLPQWALDNALDNVKENAAEFLAIRQGEIEPERCERCDYCRSTRVLTEPMNYESFFE